MTAVGNPRHPADGTTRHVAPCAGYGRTVSEMGNPVNPEDDEAEATEPAEERTQDNPDVDEE